MYLCVYVPLLVSALFAVVAPGAARRLPPAACAWLLSAGGLLVAAASSAALLLLSLTLAARLPQLAQLGHWSQAALRRDDPVATPVAAAALLLLVVVSVRAARALAQTGSALREAYRVAAALPAHGAELTVLDSPQPGAYAVPGRPGRAGRIVVTTGLLRRLGAGERRALLSHERSHLVHRHHLHHCAASLAAAANPLLRRLPAAVATSCERWADEDAAADCDRDVVADALTRAGTGGRLAGNRLVLAGVVDVADRIQALRAPPPRLTVWRLALVVAALVALVAAAALSLADAAHDLNALFETAQAALAG